VIPGHPGGYPDDGTGVVIVVLLVVFVFDLLANRADGITMNSAAPAQTEITPTRGGKNTWYEVPCPHQGCRGEKSILLSALIFLG